MLILNVKVNNCSFSEAIDHVFSSLREAKKFSVFFLNLNCLYMAQSDGLYRSVLNSADLVFLDGIGLRMIMKMLGMEMRDDCNGTDLSPALLQRAAKEGYKIFFLGAQEGVAEKAAEKMRIKIPGIDIVGTHHGYFDDDKKVISQVNASGADILFVAMGVPLQEKWIVRNRESLNPRLCLGVGALLDYLSGTIPRAPLWLRSLHLEWLWRVFLDPMRFGKRYFVNGPKIFWLALGSRFMEKQD